MNKIHIINPFWDAGGGNEWEAIQLYRELLAHGHHETYLWSEYRPVKEFLAMAPIRRIHWQTLRFPKTGTFVFSGVYYYVSRWIELARPRRVIVKYNIHMKDHLEENLDRLSIHGKRPVEIVYCSEHLRDSVDRPGTVEIPLIDIDLFRPAAGDGTARERGAQFVVGRLSRDTPLKHHPEDPGLYRRLAAEGCRVRVMGGTCLADELGDVENIELLPAGSVDAWEFLRSLDCFFYRTDDSLVEGHGRIVTEAMATGLPAVCHTHGGYMAMIASGVNGFLFDTTDEAAETILRLRDDRDLCRRIGTEARRSMEQLFSPEARRRLVEWYEQ